MPVEVHRPDLPNETVDMVGPVCETGDFFARDRELPVVDEGDWLAILRRRRIRTWSLTSHYNTRPRAGRSAGGWEVGEGDSEAGDGSRVDEVGVVIESSLRRLRTDS